MENLKKFYARVRLWAMGYCPIHEIYKYGMGCSTCQDLRRAKNQAKTLLTVEKRGSKARKYLRMIHPGMFEEVK